MANYDYSYPTLHVGNIYRSTHTPPDSTIYNDETQTLLTNAEVYANTILHPPSFITRFFNKILGPSSQPQPALLVAVGCYLLFGRAHQKIEESRTAALNILNSEKGLNGTSFNFFTVAEHRDINRMHVRWISILHVRMLLREEKDAEASRLKAIGMIATGTVMVTGAMLASTATLYVSGACAVVLGAKILYDLTRTSSHAIQNKLDANDMLTRIAALNTLSNNVIHAPAEHPQEKFLPPVPDLVKDKNNELVTTNNWMKAPPPPLSQGASSYS